MKIKTAILIGFILLNSQTIAQEYQQMQKVIHALATNNALRQGQWSVSATYVKSGKNIIALNSDQCLAPASGLKLITTAAALDILGESFRFKTEIYHDGYITKDGKLSGNIYLVGGGDPTLGSDLVKGSPDLDSLMQFWKKAVVNAGIKSIQGAIIADDLLFDRLPLPDQWAWIDIGNYYAAPISALTIHDNLYYLYLKPGRYIGDATVVLRTEPFVHGLSFTNLARTGAEDSGDNAYIDCAPGQYNALLRGTIPANHDEFSIKGSIPEPALFAARFFSDYLQKAGIGINGPPACLAAPVSYNQAHKLCAVLSPELKDIVFIINKRSNNLYAEQLVKFLAVFQKKDGSFENGINAIEDFLNRQKIDCSGLKLYDGSGLSRTNTVTTGIMTRFLLKMTVHPAYKSFYNSLGITGDPDDISFFRKFGNGTVIAKNARIKSGLTEGVRSHSGYVRDLSGDLIAFSIIANNFTGALQEVDSIHENVILNLARLP